MALPFFRNTALIVQTFSSIMSWPLILASGVAVITSLPVKNGDNEGSTAARERNSNQGLSHMTAVGTLKEENCLN
jgi:hypothetical protein